MKRFRPLTLAVFFLGLAAVSTVRAHDPYTSWADVRVRGDTLEITLTLARSAGLRLLPDGAAPVPLTDGTAAAYSAPLRTAAAACFAPTIDGRPLQLREAAVALGDKNDLTLRLVYVRPTGRALTLRAHYLDRQLDGHVGTVAVSDEADRDLGWAPLSVDEPVLTVSLTKPAAASGRP